jgi:methionyl-tRNA synthetase
MNANYFTTSIPYVNGHPHIGFALELVQADVLARWARQRGEDTFFLTGTDENAIKNVQVALQQHCTPKDLCDRNAEVYRLLVQHLDISADNFIRTSSHHHHHGASLFWSKCRKEDIYLKHYRGLYCLGCEDFLRDEVLENGLCPFHNAAPELVEEENYFFRLTAYAERLDHLIRSGKLRINPVSRQNEALSLIRQGLWDFSISRPADRSKGWGISVPGDPSQILYVWFDALTNYLTGLGYGADGSNLNRYWQTNSRKVHVLGKDILKFHALYWPAMLLSAGLPPPDVLHVHGFLTTDGEKIGKSLGNAVDPLHIIQTYGKDALRYFLLKAIQSDKDGDFSIGRFEEIYNSDLANGLGNLVRRVQTLCHRADISLGEGSVQEPDEEIGSYLGDFRFREALRHLWNSVRILNRRIDSVRPWDLAKEGKTSELVAFLEACRVRILSLATGLKPFIPDTANRIETAFLKDRIIAESPLFPRITS